MATKIFPSANDINAGVSGDGKTIKEKNLADLISMVTSNRNKIITGFAYANTSASLTLSIPAGSAIVAGRYVLKDAAENLVLTASATNHLYLQVVLDASNNATAANFVANTTGTAPADSIKLGTATTSATAVTSTTKVINTVSGEVLDLGTTPPATGKNYPTIHLGGWSSIYAYNGDTLGNVSAWSVGVNVNRSDFPSTPTYRTTGTAVNFWMQTLESGAPQIKLGLHPSGAAGAALAPVTAGIEISTTGINLTGPVNISTAGITTVNAVNVNHITHPVAGYVKVGTGIYRATSLPALVALASATLTAIAAPAGAKGLILHIHAVAKSTGTAGGARGNIVNVYSDSAGTLTTGVVQITTFEFVATTAGTDLAVTKSEIIAPVIGGSAYVKDGGLGVGSYAIAGYTV